MLNRSAWLNAAHVLVVAAHPDDETLGLGGQLPLIPNVTLIHVTDGAPRSRPDWQHYAEVRRAELLKAAALAGIDPSRCLEIGIADQEASTHLVELTCRLSTLFRELAPDVVFTHPYEGAHPDHDATAFAVHHALASQALLLEFASYHRSPRDQSMEPGCFFDEPELRILLKPEEQLRKRAMLACFASQHDVLRHCASEIECFRRAPAYDFSKPPRPGPLFYESFDWGVNGSEWRRLARKANRMIGPCLSH